MASRMGLLGKKIGMTQTFDQKGTWMSLAVIEMGPCVVLDVKTLERDGYAAIQLGFGDKHDRLTSKPQAGLFKKADTAPKRFIREIRLTKDQIGQFKIGQTVTVGQVFQPGDLVDVVGTSKGKGFQGVIKRYHFSGTRATHGSHEYFRHGGSIGCRLTPGRVMKGKKMPGQMGNKRVTVQNVRVANVLEDKNLLLLAGAVPGAPEGFIVIKQAIKHAPRPLRLQQPEAAPSQATGEQEAAQAE